MCTEKAQIRLVVQHLAVAQRCHCSPQAICAMPAWPPQPQHIQHRHTTGTEATITLLHAVNLALLRLRSAVWLAYRKFRLECGTGHYKNLMAQFNIVVEVFLGLDEQYQDVIADITRRMGAGMAEFIQREVRAACLLDTPPSQTSVSSAQRLHELGESACRMQDVCLQLSNHHHVHAALAVYACELKLSCAVCRSRPWRTTTCTATMLLAWLVSASHSCLVSDPKPKKAT